MAETDNNKFMVTCAAIKCRCRSGAGAGAPSCYLPARPPFLPPGGPFLPRTPATGDQCQKSHSQSLVVLSLDSSISSPTYLQPSNDPTSVSM